MRGGPRSRAVSIDPGKIELDAFGEILGIDRELAVIARRQGDPGRKADRGGHDEAVIVVGVLADQVDASGGAINARVTAIQPPEFPLQIICLIRPAYFSCFITNSLHKNCDGGAACFTTNLSGAPLLRVRLESPIGHMLAGDRIFPHFRFSAMRRIMLKNEIRYATQ